MSQEGQSLVEQALERNLFGDGGAPETDAQVEEEQPLPEAAAEPDAPSEPATEPVDDEEEHRAKTVPLAALHEERTRRKELAEQLRQEAERRAVMEERFQQFQAAVAARLNQPQQPAPPPSFEDDPAAHLKTGVDHVDRRTQALEQRLAQMQHEQVSRQQAEAIKNAAAAAVAQFREQTPDYADAYQHVRSMKTAELAALGNTPDQIEAAHRQAEAIITMQALRAGKNPAAVMYDMAKALGYKGVVQGQQAQGQNLGAVSAGVERGKSLGSGGRPGGRISLSELAAMDLDEFSRVTGGDAFRKLMGG